MRFAWRLPHLGVRAGQRTTTTMTMRAPARDRHARGPQAGWRCWLLACALAGPAAAAAQDTAGLAGYWSGHTGSGRERVAVGLDLQPDSEGGLSVRLDLPIAHMQSMAMGSARVEDGVLRLPGLHLALERKAGRLTGTLLDPAGRADLRHAGPRPSAMPSTAATDAPVLPGPRWSVRLSGQVFASPAVDGGIAYVGTTGGTFEAVDVRNGHRIWSAALGFPVFASAAVEADAVYVTSDGFLHRLDRADGHEVWRYPLAPAPAARVLPHPDSAHWDWQAPRPLRVGDALYVGSADGGLHAVDAGSGRRLWRFAAPGRIRHGAAADARHIYVASEPGSVHALDPRTGEEQWRHALSGQPGAAPVVHQGRVYASDRGALLHALDARDGHRLWLLPFWTSWVESAPVIVDDTLYIGSSDLKRISAIDAGSGKVRWRSEVAGWSWGTPLPDGHHLFVATAAGAPYFQPLQAELAMLDRADGQVLARLALPAGEGFVWGVAGGLARDGDTLVAATVGGTLMGFTLPTDATTQTDAGVPPSHARDPSLR